MNILVTGANGMLGRCLKEQTISDPNKWIWLNGRSECDLTDHTQVNGVFNTYKPDIVIHLAAAVGGLYFNEKHNAKMLRDNIMMNTNVIDCCYNFGVKKAIFILSSCIYPSNPTKYPMDESMIDEGPPHPTNEGYAYAKRVMWSMVKHYRQDYDLDYRCLIPVNLYGPHDTFDQEKGHAIPGIMMRFHNGDYTCRGTGRPLRQFLYTPDLARIIMKTLHEDKVPDMICAGQELTIGTMAGTMAEIMGKSANDVKFQPNYTDGCMRKTVTDQLFRSLYPDFRYTSLKDGLKATYKWYIKNDP